MNKSSLSYSKNKTRLDKQILSIHPLCSKSLQRYNDLFLNSDSKSIFLCKEWLSVYSNDNIADIIFIEKGGIDIAALVVSKTGKPLFRMKLSGPIIRKPVQSYKLSTHYQYYGAIYTMFSLYIKNRFLVYYDLWEYQHNYWYPLLWQGFSQETRYHFQLQLNDMEQVWKNFSTKIRTDIRKATSSGLEVKSSSFDSFSLEQLSVFGSKSASFC